MKFSRRCPLQYRPRFIVEDVNGNQLPNTFDYESFGEALAVAREYSCSIRGGCRVNVVMSSFRIEGARIVSEVLK